jgi:hypothetical protein
MEIYFSIKHICRLRLEKRKGQKSKRNQLPVAGWEENPCRVKNFAYLEETNAFNAEK